MNANFRRDYSYRATEDLLGVEEGEFLRYLKYDRGTKSYLFLTGKYSNKEEKLIVVPRNKAQKAYTRFKKLECIDYYPTNDYQGDFGKLINKSSQLEIGSKYVFNAGEYLIDESQPLELTEFKPNCLGREAAYFKAPNLVQQCELEWLNTGVMSARLVG